MIDGNRMGHISNNFSERITDSILFIIRWHSAFAFVGDNHTIRLYYENELRQRSDSVNAWWIGTPNESILFVVWTMDQFIIICNLIQLQLICSEKIKFIHSSQLHMLRCVLARGNGNSPATASYSSSVHTPYAQCSPRDDPPTTHYP